MEENEEYYKWEEGEVLGDRVEKSSSGNGES